jgi:hypothetical protein
MFITFLTIVAWLLLPLLIVFGIALAAPGKNRPGAALAYILAFLCDVAWLAARYLFSCSTPSRYLATDATRKCRR